MLQPLSGPVLSQGACLSLMWVARVAQPGPQGSITPPSAPSASTVPLPSHGSCRTHSA